MLYIVYKSVSIMMTALFALLSVSSCGVLQDQVPASVAAENISLGESGETISILQSRGEIGQEMQKVADQYAVANGGARVSVHTVAGDSDYGVALRSRLLSGERVDIFHLSGRRDMLELRPYLEDLSGLSWIRDAAPGTLDTVTLEGKIYGIPYSIEGAGLIVNGDIFEKAGIYLGNVASIAALEKIFKELQDFIDSGDLGDILPELEAVTEFSAQDKGYLNSTIADILLTGAFPSPAAAYSAPYLEMPMADNARNLIRVMALYSSCTSWDQLNSVTQSRQLEAGLASGRVAAILQDAEAYRRVLAANPSVAGKLRILPVPLGTDEAPQSAIYTGVPAYWSINSGSSGPARESALRFLTWLYQSDSGASAYASRFMAISPYRNTVKGSANPLHSQIIRMMENGGTLPMLHRACPSGWREDVLTPGIQGFFSKETTWEETIQEYKEKWHLEQILLE